MIQWIYCVRRDKTERHLPSETGQYFSRARIAAFINCSQKSAAKRTLLPGWGLNSPPLVPTWQIQVCCSLGRILLWLGYCFSRTNYQSSKCQQLFKCACMVLYGLQPCLQRNNPCTLFSVGNTLHCTDGFFSTEVQIITVGSKFSGRKVRWAIGKTCCVYNQSYCCPPIQNSLPCNYTAWAIKYTYTPSFQMMGCPVHSWRNTPQSENIYTQPGVSATATHLTFLVCFQWGRWQQTD